MSGWIGGGERSERWRRDGGWPMTAGWRSRGVAMEALSSAFWDVIRMRCRHRLPGQREGSEVNRGDFRRSSTTLGARPFKIKA